MVTIIVLGFAVLIAGMLFWLGRPFTTERGGGCFLLILALVIIGLLVKA